MKQGYLKLRLCRALLFVWLLVTTGFLSAHQTVNSHGHALPTYVVGVENIDYYPHFAFTYRSSFAEALFLRFNHAAGIHFEFSALPVTRLYDALLSKQTIDFKFPDSPEWAPERKQGQRIYYSDPISEYVEGIYVLPENLGRGLDGLKRLGIVQGFTPNALSEALSGSRIELVREADLGKLLLMCLRGEIDGVYANMDLSHHWVTDTSKPPHGLMFDHDLPFVRGQFHLSTTRYPELIQQLNSFLRREQRQVQELKAVYGLKARP